jgi:intracellular septation protein A
MKRLFFDALIFLALFCCTAAVVIVLWSDLSDHTWVSGLVFAAMGVGLIFVLLDQMRDG